MLHDITKFGKLTKKAENKCTIGALLIFVSFGWQRTHWVIFAPGTDINLHVYTCIYMYIHNLYLLRKARIFWKRNNISFSNVQALYLRYYMIVLIPVSSIHKIEFFWRCY